jgi:hypothetical protein
LAVWISPSALTGSSGTIIGKGQRLQGLNLIAYPMWSPNSAGRSALLRRPKRMNDFMAVGVQIRNQKPTHSIEHGISVPPAPKKAFDQIHGR